MNEETGATGLKQVEEVFCTEAHTIHEITVEGKEVIKATAYHPFYVSDKGWVDAINLEVGDRLVTTDGTAEITQISKSRHDEPIMTYNFHVEDWTSYFVSERNVYVHNPVGDHDEIVDIELKYKDDWTSVQKAEADAKVKALSEANTVKTTVNKSKTSASSRYKSANGKTSVPSGSDVDHTIDLQLGGADDILNMNPLDMSVNRSLGSQI